MGTAGAVTFVRRALDKRHKKAFYLPDLRAQFKGDCEGVESGHFGVYFERAPIADSVFACDEDKYLRDAEAAGAWGAVNHPDNPDYGSRWFCWDSDDSRPLDDSMGPDNNALGPPCRTGATRVPSVARAVEVINDSQIPTRLSLDRLDTLLLQGRRVALVGGSDSHTSRPDQQLIETYHIGPKTVQLPNVGVGKQLPGNDDKLGLAGRTYVYDPSGAVANIPDNYDATAEDDPVRLAISRGQTIASNGPLAVPSISGTMPGGTVTLRDRHVAVDVDFKHPWKALGRPDAAAAVPDRVRVVAGWLDACEVGTTCQHQNRRVLADHVLSPEEKSAGGLSIPLKLPNHWGHAYLRTEALYEPTTTGKAELDARYDQRQFYRYGSYASPIYVQRDAFALPTTQLEAGCPRPADWIPVGAPTDDRLRCEWVTELDLDGNGKPDRLITWLSGPEGGAVAYLDDGSYHWLEEPWRRWKTAYDLKPRTIQPIQIIRGLAGTRDLALVTYGYGSSTRWSALLTMTADRRLHVVRKKPNEEVMGVPDGSAAAYASTFGCLSIGAGRFFGVAGGLSWPADVELQTAGRRWAVDLYRLVESHMVATDLRLGGYSRKRVIWPVANGERCAGRPGQLPVPLNRPRQPDDVIRALLTNVQQGRPQLAQFLIGGSYGDVSLNEQSGVFWDYNPYGFLKNRKEFIPGWIGKQPRCSTSFVPYEGAARMMTCQLTQQGQFTVHFLMAKLPPAQGRGWVVAAVGIQH
jgi:hypothetical protein